MRIIIRRMPIPEEEYFGACLWQMVKALHSPYKSVMKLGLLEKYAGQGEEMRLLCDRIKEAVLRGRSLLSDVDPYLSLFTSIRKHYRQLGDATSLALIGECLRLKADVAPRDLPEEFGAPEASASPDAAAAVMPDLQITVRAPRHILGDRVQPGMHFQLFFGRIDPLANELKVIEAREAE